MTKVTYICCSAKKQLSIVYIVYSHLLVFYFIFIFIFSSTILTRFLGVSQQEEFKNTETKSEKFGFELGFFFSDLVSFYFFTSSLFLLHQPAAVRQAAYLPVYISPSVCLAPLLHGIGLIEIFSARKRAVGP
jgi:hypothetical protein